MGHGENLLYLPANPLETEWLETNGLGGFASSTVSGCNTRRYHALLVTDPHATTEQMPAGRRAFLNTVEDALTCSGARFELATNFYEGAIYPEGYNYITDFARFPWPTVIYETGQCRLRREVFMPWGQNTVVLRYTLEQAPEPATLALKPLVSGRDFHHLIRADEAISPRVHRTDEQFSVALFDEASTVWLWYGGASLSGHDDDFRHCWYYGFHYPVEARRGLDAAEDLYCPAEISWHLEPGDQAVLIASTQPVTAPDVDAWDDEERTRRELIAAPAGDDNIARHLFLAADQFIIKRNVGHSIIAGYPWFNDWGRDTMIALPGLTIATKRYDMCKSILSTWLSHMHDGLVPNVFGDDGSAAYNTADATLWMFAAARDYYRSSRDLEFFRGGIYDALIAAVNRHISGTGHEIAMDPDDGLLVAGTPDTQLTWMDAKVGTWVVTPRHGKPVEINALWYNALRTAHFLADKFGDRAAVDELAAIAVGVRRSFVETFFSDELGYCYDVIGPDGPDASLRPNQLIACSLQYSLLSSEQVRSVVDVCRGALLTPPGMRTLAPDHPAYRGRYEGDVWSRDGAYHQGTVWPWLIGPYLKAYRIAYGSSPETREYMRNCLSPLMAHLLENGSICEIFDGDEPQYPRGCIAQAWSVAQALECWLIARES